MTKRHLHEPDQTFGALFRTAIQWQGTALNGFRVKLSFLRRGRQRWLILFSLDRFPLLRRARFGVRFYFVPLFLDDAAQFAFHRFERVVDHFGERIVRAVVRLFLVGDEFVAA